MKYLAITSLIAFALTFTLISCLTPPPPQVADCRDALNALLNDYVAKGLHPIGAAQFAPGVIGRFFEGPTEEKTVLVYAAPGAPQPPPESPFVFVKVCTTPLGDGRIYEANIAPEQAQ